MAKLINKTQGNFTIVNNQILRDKNLGIKERGLLITLLSLPDSWEFSILGLAAILPDGKDAIGNCVKKLEKAGYLRRIQAKNDNGQFAGYDWKISDNPIPKNPETVKAETRNTLPDNQAQSNTDKLNTKKSNTNISNTNLILSYQEDEIRRELEETTAANFLFETEHNDLDKDIFEIMVEICCSTKEYYKISGNTIPTKNLQNRIKKMDYEHIRHVRESIEKTRTPIINTKAYIIKCLYDAPVTIGAHYTNRVAVDMA